MTSILLAVLACPAYAQAIPVPGAADAGRITPENKLPPIQGEATAPAIAAPHHEMVPPPPEAAHYKFELKSVTLNGVHAYSDAQLAPLYQDYIGQTVTLDVVWKIANAISDQYHKDGYFLSRAFVPAQKIEGGDIVIDVVEGYIGAVDIDQTARSLPLGTLNKMIDGLKAQKPLKSQDLESFLLRINDMPGVSFRAVLAPVDDKDDDTDGMVQLNLITQGQKGTATIGFDNLGSRYLGPNEATMQYRGSFIPLQETTVSAVNSVPTKELNSFFVKHRAVVAPAVTAEVDGSLTHAQPGYTLNPLDIKSTSTWVKGALEWQYLRQRDQNLSFSAAIDGRNTNSSFLNTPLTRDRIRVARLGASYILSDRFSGYNTVDATLSRGLGILGASKKNDADLSRLGANPDFTTLQVAASRVQPVYDQFSLYAAAAGQWASSVLYSAEAFGYGGLAFGRAYDASEITGDNGISGSLELRYGYFDDQNGYDLVPYVFYDIGSVWQRSANGPTESGSSAGAGVRFHIGPAVSGNIGLAFPLTRSISAPVYGEKSSGPRPLVQVMAAF